MDFAYWDSVDPATFLRDDWGNPARAWASKKVRAAVANGTKTMVEVGPGPGVDYAWFFRHIPVQYTGWEGSVTLCRRLQERFPEAQWENRPLLDLPERGFDLLYCKAVLEHQPALEPSLSRLLVGARTIVLLTWYRPPGDIETITENKGVYYNTYRRADALEVIASGGWKLEEETNFASGPCGNLCWLLTRKP